MLYKTTQNSTLNPSCKHKLYYRESDHTNHKCSSAMVKSIDNKLHNKVKKSKPPQKIYNLIPFTNSNIRFKNFLTVPKHFFSKVVLIIFTLIKYITVYCLKSYIIKINLCKLWILDNARSVQGKVRAHSF